jgi:hypothetical protein
VDEALREIYLQTVHLPFRALVNADTLHRLLSTPARAPQLDEVQHRYLALVRAVKQFSGGLANEIELALQMRRELQVVMRLHATLGARRATTASKYLREYLTDDGAWATLVVWVWVHALGRAQEERDYVARSRAWLDEWMLDQQMARALQEFGLTAERAWRAVHLIKLMTQHQQWFTVRKNRAARLLEMWLSDDATREFLGVNQYQGVWWFHKESFDELLFWMYTSAVVLSGADVSRTAQQIAAQRRALFQVVRTLRAAERKSKYQVERLRALVR